MTAPSYTTPRDTTAAGVDRAVVAAGPCELHHPAVAQGVEVEGRQPAALALGRHHPCDGPVVDRPPVALGEDREAPARRRVQRRLEPRGAGKHEVDPDPPLRDPPGRRSRSSGSATIGAAAAHTTHQATDQSS